KYDIVCLMSDPFNEDLIAAKSAFAAIGAAAVFGAILLFNAETQTIWGVAKGIAGIALCVAAIFGARALYKGL
ncbi:hypothetical protein, partial [Sphingobium sp. AEW4]